MYSVGLLLCAVPAAWAYFAFDAEGPFWIYPAACVMTVTLSLLQLRGLLQVRFLRRAALIPLLFTGIYIMVLLYVTPGSAYRVWFEVSRSGIPSGTITYFMFLKLTFFTLIALLLWSNKRYLPALISLCFPAALTASLILQHPLLAVLSFLLLVTGFLSLSMSGTFSRGFRYLVTFMEIMAVSALIAIPFASLQVPQPTLFQDFVSRNDLDNALLRVFPGLPLVSDMPGYENEASAWSLGGRPLLGSHPVFYLRGKTGETVYLRSLSYDYYTGFGWEHTLHESAENTPGASLRIEAVTGEHFAVSDLIEVEVAADFYSSIPHILDTEDLLFPVLPAVQKGNLNIGIIVAPPLIRGMRYFISRKRKRFDVTESEMERYLQITGTMPPEIRQLAESLGRETVEGTLTAIQTHLIRNYSYSLNVPKPAESQDFLTHFLFDLQKGYCVHFSTACTMLCRLNGIPARYVSGYLARFPFDSDTIEITPLQSHTWCEVWTEDAGWRIVEATSVLSDSAVSAGKALLSEDTDPLTQRQLRALRGERADESLRYSLRILLLTAAGVLSASLLILVIIRLIRHIFIPGAVLPRAVLRIVAHFAAFGVESPLTNGWVQWEEDAAACCPRLESGVRDMVLRIEVHLYQEKALDHSDYQFFRDLYRKCRTCNCS